MTKYRKKPTVIDAVQHHGEPIKINTLEGIMVCNDGDWIITGVKGEKYPCKDDIFQLTYEKVEERNIDQFKNPRVKCKILEEWWFK
jgi:hypothetical protein